jgi:hypothetical protein
MDEEKRMQDVPESILQNACLASTRPRVQASVLPEREKEGRRKRMKEGRKEKEKEKRKENDSKNVYLTLNPLIEFISIGRNPR